MRAQRRVRLAVVALLTGLAVAAYYGVTSPPAPATGSLPMVQYTTVPGLSSVTYGQTVAYTASIKNTSILPLLEVQLHAPIPSTSGGPATDPSATCGGKIVGAEFVCPPIKLLRYGETATVTITWRTPSSGTSSDCAAATPPAIEPCLTSGVYWSVLKIFKFKSTRVGVSLISATDPNQAAGVAESSCTDPSTSETISTLQALDPTTNPLSTKVCAPAPSLIASVEESDDLPKPATSLTQVSQVCLAALSPQGCATPFVFPADSPATFTFAIDNRSLPTVCKVMATGGKGHSSCDTAKITKVFHDPDNDGPEPYAQVPTSQVTITVDKIKKITTAVVVSPSNGRWTFG